MTDPTPDKGKPCPPHIWPTKSIDEPCIHCGWTMAQLLVHAAKHSKEEADQ